MSLKMSVGIALAATFAAVCVGCGGAQSGAIDNTVVCGPGTYEVDGECLPSAEADGGEGGAPHAEGADVDGGGGNAGEGARDGASSADASDALPNPNVDLLTACFGDHDMLLLEGEPGNPLHAGELRIEGGDGWKVEGRGEGALSTVVVHAGTWHATFSTEALGEPLTIATYLDAQRAGEEAPKHAGLNVSSGDVACDTVNGRFSVLELETIPTDAAVPRVGNVIMTFEQHCGSGPALRGCLHVRGN